MPGAMKPAPLGYPAVSPYLTVRDAAAAIEFYASAFGAEERAMRLTGPSGEIVHAEIDIGGSLIMLSEEAPQFGTQSPQALGGTSVRLSLHVDDVDATAERAVAAGAKLLIPVSEQFYGHRSGRLEDPFGHVWVISTVVEEMSREEMQKRADDLFGKA